MIGQLFKGTDHSWRVEIAPGEGFVPIGWYDFVRLADQRLFVKNQMNTPASFSEHEMIDEAQIVCAGKLYMDYPDTSDELDILHWNIESEEYEVPFKAAAESGFSMDCYQETTECFTPSRLG